MIEINKYSTIEDIVRHKPDSVGYLLNRGIRCIVCGEPLWVTLETAAKEKGFSDIEIDGIVRELNSLKSDKET